MIPRSDVHLKISKHSSLFNVIIDHYYFINKINSIRNISKSSNRSL